jgi:Trypsin
MTGTIVRRTGVAGAAASLIVAAGWLGSAPAAGVSGGAPVPQGLEFAAHILVGNTDRACSGALIDPERVITATSCLADGPVPAGPPPAPVTVTVGRSDLSATTGGHRLAVTQVVPHPSRDVVLAKLAAPVPDIAPVAIDTAAPAAGETLRVAGFGRTATEWVPDRLHAAALTVQDVGDGAFGLAAPAETPATVCKGDGGGPTLRPSGTSFRLIGLHQSSGQAGCFGAPAGQTGGATVETRLDDLATWVQQNVRGGNFVRLTTSAAVLDTRSAIGAPAGARAAGSTTTFPVAGVGGVPATGVSAVLIDVTAITGASAGHLTVFPEGTPRDPALSMVNPAPNQIISNTVVVPVPASGKLSVFNSGPGEHIVVDVEGYYTTAPSSTGGGFVPVPYTRVVDTRSGLGGGAGVLNSGASRSFTLTGGVVPAGSSALMMDLIVTGATRQGWVGTVPAGGANRSVMDYVAGTTSHAVAVKLGADGRATFTNNSGSPVHLVMTATRSWTGSATTGAGLRTRVAKRLLDTRNVGAGTPLAANAAIDLPVALPPGSTVLMNLTVVSNTGAGFLRAWPAGGAEPSASLVNFPPANTGARSSLAAIRVGTDGKITIRNASSGTAHLIAEIQGWHAP